MLRCKLEPDYQVAVHRDGVTRHAGLGGLHDLKQAGSTLPATNAHRHDSVLHAAPPAFYQGVSHQTGAAYAVRVSNCDRTTVDVEPIQGNTQTVRAIQYLHGKRFVQFPQTDVVDRETCSLQELRNGEHRPDPHLVGLAAGDCKTPEDPQRLQSAAFGES